MYSIYNLWLNKCFLYFLQEIFIYIILLIVHLVVVNGYIGSYRGKSK